jgi:hypothetical protein
MQSLSEYGSQTLEAGANRTAQKRRREDRVYQVMTVAAIVVVLVSVWVF